MESVGCGLDIDPCLGAEQQLQFMSTGQDRFAEHATELRKNRSKRRFGSRRRRIRPKHIQQQLTRRGPVVMGSKEGEQQPPLPARQLVFYALAMHTDSELATEVNARFGPVLQGFPNLLDGCAGASYRDLHRRRR